MAKEIKVRIKMQLQGGAATPAPPVGPALGQHGVSAHLQAFCKDFNAKTAHRKGETVPVVITVYTDRTLDFEIKSAPVTEMIKKKIKITKGSSRPNVDKVGRISWSDVEEIAKNKLEDLNAFDIEQAKKIVAGSARSMGVEVID